MIEVDPNTMGETAKALLWVIGALLAGGGGYVLGNKRKVQLDPPNVEVSPTLCSRHLKDNSDDHANIFLRLDNLGQRVSALEATMPQIRDTLTRIDGKVDSILMRGLPND
ncbi:MAG: hypothetical protein ACI4QJ_00790 [Candidatus Spyradenecus sp.]